MSTHSTASRIATARRQHWTALHRRVPAGARLHLHETPLGTWVVREEHDRCGGTFLTQAAAVKFIRSEFGADATIIATDLAHKKAA